MKPWSFGLGHSFVIRDSTFVIPSICSHASQTSSTVIASISEGGALQRAGRYAEALEKFRESRRYYPRSEVDEHIRKLEEFLKK